MQTASGLKKAKVPKVHLVALFFGLRRKEKETVRRVPGLAAFFLALFDKCHASLARCSL